MEGQRRKLAVTDREVSGRRGRRASGSEFRHVRRSGLDSQRGDEAGQSAGDAGRDRKNARDHEAGDARRSVRDVDTGLFYVPGNFTPPDEVIEIAKVAGAMGGMHISHMRNESAHILDSVKETIRIGEEGHMPTQVTHHKIIGSANWGLSKQTLELVEAGARARSRCTDRCVSLHRIEHRNRGADSAMGAGGRAEGSGRAPQRTRRKGHASRRRWSTTSRTIAARAIRRTS